jgi:hypothetical protein
MDDTTDPANPPLPSTPQMIVDNPAASPTARLPVASPVHHPTRPPERLVATVPAPGISLPGTLRFFGAVIGTVALLICLTVAGVYIGRLCEASGDPTPALIAITAAIGIGVVLGIGLTFVSARVYAKALFAVLALMLVTAGVLMAVFAFVARQMNTEDLAEYRAFSALLWFGSASIIAGLALGAACLRWALRPHARTRLARWSRIIGSAYGVWLGISGVAGIALLFRLVDASATYNRNGEFSVVEQAVSIAAIAMMSFVPGLILTYHCISSSMGESSSEFRAPWAVFGLAAWAGVIMLGQANMSREDPVAAYMPVLHVAAAALPGLTFAMLAARGSVLRGQRVRWITWRQWTLAIALAMSVATVIAIYVESLGSVAAIVLLLVHNGAFESAANWNGVTDVIGDSDLILTRGEQFAAGLITAAVCAPLVEEFGKSLSVRFVLRPSSTRAQAFALGAAAGAGFGFIEAMFYGLAGIQDDLGAWWQIMLLRGGSTSLHVLCTGLGGLAWWYWSVGRRPRAGWLLFGLAVLFHASWNAAFTVIDSRIFGLETLSDRTLETIAYTIVAVISGAFIFAIPIVARRLREPVPPPVEGTELALMSPWIA